MKAFRLLLIVILLKSATLAYAHSGKTDANGCHTEKKTGEYHCHGGSDKVAKTQARTSAPSGRKTLICSANIYNCADFSSHNEAQNTYESCLDNIGNDVHALDRDNDGVACEELL